MEFKAKRRKLKVTVDDQVFEVSFPKLGELSEYREKLETAESKGKVLTNWLASLGFPEDAQNQLEAGDLTEIIEILTDQKKS
jgi:hypothetical protein